MRSGISIHAPARGATQYVKRSFYHFIISIHAPARGATSLVVSGISCGIISIHAPARGATALPDSPFQAITNFNPRSRTGSDGV